MLVETFNVSHVLFRIGLIVACQAYPAGVRLKSSPLYRNLNSEQEREKSSAAAYHQINVLIALDVF